jgi:peptidoglycan/xylan/chitin deacetylase (PgdA/CDA1 family)
MQKLIRDRLLRALKAGGIFDRVRDSRWRQHRLLILCYHSLALEEENQWRPGLFLAPSRLRERFEMLKQGGYSVLPLGEALNCMRRNTLPPRTVVLTFDDGTYDFYKLTYPLLKEYGFPATVYQTTYYCSRAMPVYSLICSYMLWKQRDAILHAAASIGVMDDVALSSAETRQMVLNQIVAFADRERLSTEQKNDLAAELAHFLGIDYAELLRKRILQLMTLQEIAELATGGVRFELHTHRHRMPRDRSLFEKEIRENRELIATVTGTQPVHFCYTSGEYDSIFLPWLLDQGVLSATTCEPGLASPRSPQFLLPRFIDTSGKSALEFESWLTGVGALLSSVAGAARLLNISRS